MPEPLNGAQVYRFDQMAVQVKDKVDPAVAAVDRYVGLEHIDPESLKIRRWGQPSDVESSKILFKAGDVIFGKRRAYQRKLAVAHFDGICSAHAMVLRPKTDVVIEQLLPFFMQSDTFMDRAVKISVGGLSPTINWRDLAKEEFALPPLEEQQRIAELMLAAADVREGLVQSLEDLDAVLRRLLIDSYATMSSRFELVGVDKFGEATMGRQKSPKYQLGENPLPYLRVANVGSLELKLDELEEMDFTPAEVEKYRLLPGDIILTEGDLVSEFNVGRPAIFRGEVADCCFQNTLIRFRPNPQMNPMFILALLEGARLNFAFAKASKTTTVTHLGLGRFRQVLLPMPNDEVQAALAHQTATLLDARRALRDRLIRSQKLNASLLSEVFG